MKRSALRSTGASCLIACLGILGEAAVAQLPPAATGGQKANPNLEALRATAQKRISLDRSLLSNDEFRDLESLYQSANRDLRSPEAKSRLKEVVRKYPRSNRAGCAVLYLAQLSSGPEREEYLRSAIADYGDAWYGDGVQVGALARAQLAVSYANAGRANDARRLEEELRSQFPGAVDHSGDPLSAGLPPRTPQSVP